MDYWILVLVQKDSNVKRESYCCTELERLFTKFITENKEIIKENQCCDNFVFP